MTIQMFTHSLRRSAFAMKAALMAALLTVAVVAQPDTANAAESDRWIATWTASPQPIWGSECPFPTKIPAKLHKQTIRQVARIGLGGGRVRIVLSNRRQSISTRYSRI